VSIDDALRSLAARQRGLVTTRQARDLGLSRSALTHRLHRGALERVTRGVLRVGGAPVSTGQHLLGAVLACGGRCAVARASAAAIWGLPGFQPLPAHIVRQRDGTVPMTVPATVHTTTILPDSHLAELDGLRVTTPARTLVDLAGHVHPERLERLIDTAWSRRLVDGRLLHRTLHELEERGRAGIVVMRELLEVRGPDYRPPESNLEARFSRVLADDGLPPMERQVDVGGEAWIGRIDFVDRACKVLVEINSDLHHTSLSDRRRDASRRAELEGAGGNLIEITEFELWFRPQEVADRTRRARLEAQARLSP